MTKIDNIYTDLVFWISEVFLRFLFLGFLSYYDSIMTVLSFKIVISWLTIEILNL